MLKRRLILLFTIFSIGIINAQIEDAWVYFKNKPNEAFYFESPLSMLSQRSLDRRTQQNIPLDSKDVPIANQYILQIKQSNGISVKAKSKWLNALHIIGTENDIRNLLSFNFVERIDFADKSLNSSGKPFKQVVYKKQDKDLQFKTTYEYGKTLNQVKLIGTDELHENDFTGKGMQIAILDAGFPNVDNFDAFSKVRSNNQIKGGYDFVNRNEDFYTGNSHGMSVLSTIAGYLDEQFVGSAPDADFYLFITEDNNKETPLEESLWVEAAEKADSLGVDLINSSLGYFTFDNPNYDYSYEDLDGKTTFISRGAEIAFSRGILVLNSVGNEGGDDWKYLIAPADAKSVLGIGAVNSEGLIAGFSSFGPTIDGRIKPDVCAQGAGVYVINYGGQISISNGTSFSSPILTGAVACLWQAFPNKTNLEITQLVKEFSNYYNNPKPQEGYGVPNFRELYKYLTKEEVEPESTVFKMYPNPTTKDVLFQFPTDVNKMEMNIYNTLGQRVYTNTILKNFPKSDVSFLNNGVYLLSLSYNNTVKNIKLIKE